ncbi:MAG: methylmalonyl-CoA epimerase [Candidatus Hermodarchaeota archaeon]
MELLCLRIAHIGIAVKDAEAALKLYREALGLEPTHTEIVESQKVKTVHIPIGDSSIELLESTSPEGVVAQFIEKRGEGIHHVAIEVPDIHAVLDKMKTAGFRLIDETPRIGADNMLIAFIHPRSTNGVLLELCQPSME